LGSISPTCLHATFMQEDPKSTKRQSSLSVFLHFWDLRAQKLRVKCWWNWDPWCRPIFESTNDIYLLLFFFFLLFLVRTCLMYSTGSRPSSNTDSSKNLGCRNVNVESKYVELETSTMVDTEFALKSVKWWWKMLKFDDVIFDQNYLELNWWNR